MPHYRNTTDFSSATLTRVFSHVCSLSSAPGTVPNQAGRVLQSVPHGPTVRPLADAPLASVPAPSAAAAPEPGLYVVGWLKRGPTGIIGTNLHDAEDTVSLSLMRV